MVVETTKDNLSVLLKGLMRKEKSQFIVLVAGRNGKTSSLEISVKDEESLKNFVGSIMKHSAELCKENVLQFTDDCIQKIVNSLGGKQD